MKLFLLLLPFLLPRLSQGLLNRVLDFSTSTTLSFHYTPLIFRQRAPFCCLQEQEGRAPADCFRGICIMLSDLVSALSWISSRHGSLSYQREEKRTSVERNGLSKGRAGLSCEDTLIVLQIGSRWGNYEREEIQGKRGSLNRGWHLQDLSIKSRFGLAGVENRRGSNILYCGGWHHHRLLQQF